MPIRRRRPEAGDTLVEVIVAVTIISVAIIALTAGLSVGIIASDVHRKKSTGDTIARNAAELLKNRNLAWQANGNYSIPTSTGFTITLAARCWDGNTPATFQACPNADRGLQELTVTVRSVSNRSVDTVTVLKRRP